MKLKNIQIAQIESITGDIKGNTKRIIDVIEKSNAEFIIFPETANIGYNCGNLFKSDKFIEESNNSIQEIVKATPYNKVVIIGSIFKTSEGLYNTAYIIYHNRIYDMYFKQSLAEFGHHSDKHWFIAGDETKVFDINGLRFSIMICEDVWESDGINYYTEMKKKNTDIVFILNASYNTYNKKFMRYSLFKNKKDFIPSIYVNNCGLGDFSKNVYVYSGDSLVVDKNRNIYKLPSYEEANETFTFNPITKEFLNVEYQKSEDWMYNTSDTYSQTMIDMSVYALRKMYEYAGIKKAMVCVSGGLDSSVVSYLAVKAMGKDNCVFVTMSSENNGDITKGNAKHLCDKLGVELINKPIQSYFELYKSDNENASLFELATFEATMRSTLALSLANKYGASLISCSGFSEKTLSWETYLDVSYAGILAPLADIGKTDVFKLAEYINKIENDEIIPNGLYDGTVKPLAELSDSNANDNNGADPFRYDVMDIITNMLVREYEWDTETINDAICGTIGLYCDYKDDIERAKKLFKRSNYKRSQAPPILQISDGESLGNSSRDTLINKWEG